MSKKIRFVPSLDCLDLADAERIVSEVDSHPSISGYKVGFSLGLGYGLPATVETIRRHSRKPVIYDHQKAGTDIPDTGALFAKTLRRAGVNEAIVFPHAGPKTLTAWIEAIRAEGLQVIVGGIMTHEAYLTGEGGFLSENGIRSAYAEAIRLGVTRFVVPLTKPDLVRRTIEALPFPDSAEFYSPGFGAQGGSATVFPFISTHHLIVGRSLLKAADPRAWLEKTCREVEAQA